MLEIASGFGHHASIITSSWSETEVQTTEAQDECLAALEALSNIEQSLLMPRKLNVLDERHWESLEDLPPYGAIYCSNLIHISPWSATDALFKYAAKLLTESGWVFLYGAYLRDGKFTSEGDEKFDASLRSRDPAFGLRDPVEVDKVAAQYGFKRVFEMDMPSNNKAFAWMR
ncbi:hypothetical protein BCR37DRAFT_352559 [Protomyces lactucae-debilis]|uniref:DUF938 domain-containing protein n=1 Tax=Protomyces lactucae-debilis TaxID=2754530 RepID=A0A1Y2EST5_PROLT|nr:uncharacterized protein BCR37DRAFT_352559 [Protomyces lactucae-debilis]ORY74602.1 hypothetical protein BCR37DRAFT_352559 [Protomyces lactucae-debilis]